MPVTATRKCRFGMPAHYRFAVDMLGHIGNLLLLLAFVGAALSLVAFLKSTQAGAATGNWMRLGRGVWLSQF